MVGGGNVPFSTQDGVTEEAIGLSGGSNICVVKYDTEHYSIASTVSIVLKGIVHPKIKNAYLSHMLSILVLCELPALTHGREARACCNMERHPPRLSCNVS